MSDKSDRKKILSQRRHEFLNDVFFSDAENKYQTKEVKDKWILVRQWNGNTKRWEVAIYTKESYDNSRLFLINH